MVAECGPCRKACFGRIFASGEQRRRMTGTSVFAPGLFAGRHILITGGATGIGFGIAEELGRLGARVTIASRDTARLEAAVARLGAAGIVAAWRQLNIRDNAAVETLFAELAAAGDLPDALVNNAGGQFAAPALETSANGFRAILDLNLQGSWQMRSEEVV